MTHSRDPGAGVESQYEAIVNKARACGAIVTQHEIGFTHAELEAFVASLPAAPSVAVEGVTGQAGAGLTGQQVYDRFSFLEGVVSERTYRKIADAAIAIQREALASPQPSAAAGDGQGARYSFVCNAGCGVCAVKVRPFEYERTETLEGEHLGSKYQPQIVSSCCGAEVHVYDNDADHLGAEVTLAAPGTATGEKP